MNAERGGRFPYFSTSMAVADGMMTSQADYLKYLSETDVTLQTTEILLEEESAGKCEDGSVRVIHYLQSNFPDSFSELFLVKGERPFTYNRTHNWHAYFIAHADREWFAGSPANYVSDDPETHLTDLLTASSLATLMETIREKDGGQWPNARSISGSLRNSYTEPYISTRENHTDIISIMTFDALYKRKEFDYTTGRMVTYNAIHKVRDYIL